MCLCLGSCAFSCIALLLVVCSLPCPFVGACMLVQLLLRACENGLCWLPPFCCGCLPLHFAVVAFAPFCVGSVVHLSFCALCVHFVHSTRDRLFNVCCLRCCMPQRIGSSLLAIGYRNIGCAESPYVLERSAHTICKGIVRSRRLAVDSISE